MEGLIGVLIGSIITIIIFRIERRDRLKLSSQERKDKFKLVAIEKRLEAHQQALKYWDKLRSVIHGKEEDSNRIKTINEVADFWFSNCLYMEKQTRNKFYDVIFLVSNYPLFLQAWHDAQGPDKEKENKYLKEKWNEVMSLPNIIMSEVELEPISIVDDKDLFGNKKNN